MSREDFTPFRALGRPKRKERRGKRYNLDAMVRLVIIGLSATLLVAACQGPQATPTPTAVPTPTSTSTPSSTATPRVKPFPTPSPFPTATATATPVPTSTAVPTPVPTPQPTPTAMARPTPTATPVPTPSPTPVPTFTLVKRVASEGRGYFAGAASRNLEFIAIGGYASTEPGVQANERHLTFFDAEGNILRKVDIGGSSWAVAMTPDGSKTVAGSDDEKLYIFEGTQLVASGRPITGNTQIRGVAISEDGRYVGAGGAKFTLLDLTAAEPLTPIFVDSATGQLRAVHFSPGGRYVAYGGRFLSSNMYLGVYDLQTRQGVFSDTIAYPQDTNAELRSIAISPDGNKIVAGNWADFIHYYVRTSSQGSWSRVQSIDAGSRVYWVDMDHKGEVVVVGVQGGGVRVYQMGTASLSLLWEQTEGMDGGQRYVSITANGQWITATTRGGGGGGGQVFLFDRQGKVLFSARSDAVRADGTYLGPNGADPEVWFGRVSEDGSKLVFASWSGFAYFYKR